MLSFTFFIVQIINNGYPKGTKRDYTMTIPEIRYFASGFNITFLYIDIIHMIPTLSYRHLLLLLCSLYTCIAPRAYANEKILQRDTFFVAGANTEHLSQYVSYYVDSCRQQDIYAIDRTLKCFCISTPLIIHQKRSNFYYKKVLIWSLYP